MAIKPVVGYTGSGWNYGGQTYKPLPAPKVPKLAAVAVNPGGSSLASALGGQRAATSNLASAIGGAPASYAPQSTVETVQPMQVYENEILSNPGYVAAKGTNAATLSNLALARKEGIDRAVISSGWDPGAQLPTSAQNYAGDIDQATRDAAAANQLSTRATLQDQLNNAMRVMPYQLAATGMGRSGQVGVQSADYNKQFQTATNQGMGDLLNAILGHVSTYASGASSANSALEAARLQVAQMLQNQAGYSRSIVQGGGGGDGYNPDLYGPGDPQISVGGGARTPAQVQTALKQPGAVNAMGGPAQYANAMSSTISPKVATAVKKIKASKQMLVGRDY